MAGFWAGFGEQLSENIEQRKKTLDRLIEENLENARVAKGKYTKNKQVANTVLKSAESIRNRYGLSKGQTLALAEAYGKDLPLLEATLDQNNNKLKANVGIGYDATDVMAFVNMSGDLEFPEDANIAASSDNKSPLCICSDGLKLSLFLYSSNQFSTKR